MLPKRIPKPVITRKDGQEQLQKTPGPKNGNGNGKRNGNRPLTILQLNFIDEYMKDPDASLTDLAIRAGYGEKYACQQAKQNLEHPVISRIINGRMQRAANRMDLRASDVIAEWGRIAFSDIGLCFNEWTTLAPHEIPEDTRRAIKSVKMRQRTIPMGKDVPPIIEREYFYEMWDKTRALDALSKNMGLFEADNRQKPAVQPQINVFVKGGASLHLPDMDYEFDDGQ